jgi:hypothetical protein
MLQELILLQSSSLTKEADLIWAGGSFDLDSPINFAVMKKIKIKVWSPKAGIIVKLKLEKAGC